MGRDVVGNDGDTNDNRPVRRYNTTVDVGNHSVETGSARWVVSSAIFLLTTSGECRWRLAWTEAGLNRGWVGLRLDWIEVGLG
jgi:hypothetical protein